MIRVLIADDHHLVRQGIRALLEKHPDIEVVGEAQDGLEAIAFTSQLVPDVLLLDINMPHISGIDVVQDLSDLGLATSIVILSMYSDDSLVLKAFHSGARGYLLKKSISEDLIAAVESAHQNRYYLSPELKSEFSEEDLFNTRSHIFLKQSSNKLTSREREVCQLVADGMTSQAIAMQLDISVKTVEKHRSNMMSKLGVRDAAGLIREAIRRRIVFLEE